MYSVYILSMTSRVDSYDSIGSSRNMVQKFSQIVEILEKYKGQYDKKLNFTELVRRLKIPICEVDEIISFILKFQFIFKDIFQEYKLKKQRRNNIVYLIAERMFRDDIPQTVEILQSYIKLINDIVYTFKFVKRGQGFDITKNGSDLISNLKKVKSEHPYLFESHGNGAIYPSKIGLKLGELIISYNKSNKEVKTIQIDNYTFHIKSEE